MSNEIKDSQNRDETEQEEQHEQDTDWKAEARKWERLAKKNVDAAKRLDEMEEASKSELQKAQERAEAAERELTTFKSKAERIEMAAKISSETGVPVDLIIGDDEEEMREFAQHILSFAKPKPAPKVPKSSTFDTNGGADDNARRQLAKKMFEIQ